MMSQQIQETQFPVVPSETEAILAQEASRYLTEMLDAETEYRFQFLQDDKPGQVVALPESVMQLLIKMLDVIGQGNAVALTPVQEEITTQQAADILNVSRPYLVQLLEENEIPHRKVGTRRRVRLQDVLAYKENMYQKRLDTLNELTAYDQELGLQ
ncbi:MAG: helix-turn-helix domain-containing protein [Chloroflexota bacterium]